MMIAGTILSIAWYLFDRKRSIQAADIWLFSIVVLFHILLPFTSEYIALQYISPSSACLMYNLSPFISALFSYFIFDEKMTLKKWLGFGIGLTGIFIYVQSQSGIHVGFSWVNLLMLASVITSCLGWIFVRILVKNKGYSTLLVNGFSMVCGGIIAFPIACTTENLARIPQASLPYIMLLLGSMILIANILFYNLYGYLLKKYTATFLSFAGFVTPLFAAFFEWLFFGVMVPHEFFMTVAIVGVGIFIFYQEELKQGYIAS